MASKKRNIIVLVVIAVVVAAALFANLGLDRKNRTKVSVEEVERGDLVAKVSGPGRVRAESKVQISSSVMAKVVRLGVDEGDTVEEGEFLLALDDVYYGSRVEQAKAGGQRAQAQLSTAERDLSDYEEQFAVGLVSERERDEIRAIAIACRQTYQEALASLRAAQDQLDKTVFHSPISGVVTRLNVEEGENVVTGTMNAPGTVIMTISDMSHMEVQVEIDETDIVDVAIGQRAEVEVEALADTVLVGTVTEVGNSGITGMAGTQEEVTNFLVTVLLDDAHPGLKPGMTATVNIVTAEHTAVLNVPIQAVVSRTPSELKEEEEGKDQSKDKDEPKLKRSERKDEKELEGVFVVDENDEARFVSVVTGIADELSLEVEGDLEAGQRVVSGPYKILRNLKNGAALKIDEKSSSDDGKE